VPAIPQREDTQNAEKGRIASRSVSSVKQHDSTDERMRKDKVRVLSRPTAIVPTIDTEPENQARIRAERESKNREANIAIALAAAEAELSRNREQREYNEGHRNRRRGEKTRSEASELYEKTGDRLRKESPQGRDEIPSSQLDNKNKFDGQQEVSAIIDSERKGSLVNRKTTSRSREEDLARQRLPNNVSDLQNDGQRKLHRSERKAQGDMLAFKLPERSRRPSSRRDAIGRRSISPRSKNTRRYAYRYI
jgi:hypothetical protein